MTRSLIRRVDLWGHDSLSWTEDSRAFFDGYAMPGIPGTRGYMSGSWRTDRWNSKSWSWSLRQCLITRAAYIT